MGKCGCGLVSREFDAIYVELDAVLEPALTLVNGQTLARARYMGFGKNAGLKKQWAGAFKIWRGL